MKTAVPGSILILLAAVCSAMAVSEPNGSCGCPAKSEVQSSGSSAGKLVHCNEIMKGFEKGQERVKVIINLAKPVETKAKTDWHSKRSLKLLHDEIKTIQTPVLSSLSENEFKLRYCFDNQAGFSGEVTLQGLEKLKNDARVISIEPVYLLEPHLRQGIPLMRADTYRSSYNGAGTAIAICDTGIDYRHPMLGNGGFPNSKVIGGYDYGDNDADPMPDSSQAHGTNCAGIAAGDLGDVGDYIGGVAYNAKLYALKITAGSSGSATSDAMVAAWDWCVTHQNDDPTHPILAISTSFGGGRNYSTCDSSNPSMTQAANDAVAAGITVLASSGNDGYCDSIAWPACISSVISVGAVYDAAFGTYYPCISSSSCATKYSTGGCSTGYYASDNTAADMVTSYSNTASFLTVLAPSNQCYTTDIIGSGGYSSGDYYSAFGGTSAACPYAAGTVACLQSAAKTIRGSYLSTSEVRTILTSTGDNITDGKVAITKPRINLQQAINSFLIDSPPTANSINVTTPLNTSLTIALQATDDGRPNPPGALNYIITSLPTNGSLSDPGAGGITAVPYTVASNGNQVVYTPTTGYSGTDNFTFKANDGGVPPYGGDSNQANVSVSIVAIFLTEGFESPFVNYAPPGWTKVFKTSTVNWVRNIGDSSSGDAAHSGTYNAMLYYAKTNNHETYLVTPAINFPSGTQSATLEFWHKQAEWLGDQDTLTVYYKTSAGGSWTLLASYTTDVPSWTQRTISLPNPSSNYYIGFLGNAKYGYGVCIDDVKVTGIVASLQRTLSISSTAGGHTEPNEGDHQFSNGTVVDINAVPDVSCHFVNWTGTGVIAGKVADPNSASTTITMDSNYTVTANFAINTFTLNYSAGTGGSLTGNTAQVVNYDANGTAVTAVPDTGYHFVNWSDDSTDNPRTDLNVTANIAVTANFVINQMTISGYITEPDANISVAGVFIDANNGGSSDITDSNGYYELWVNYDWSGTVIPTKEGYNFEPNGIFYNNVVTNEVNDYTATLSTFIVSGHITDGITPISDVNVSAENGGGQWTSRYGGGFDKTDVNGYYTVVVDYNWSGAVTPTKYAYAFDEPNIVYTNILADQNGQDYTGRLLTFTISGYVRNDCNIPIKDIEVTANNGGNSVITDANGYYEVWVDYNWSGKVTVSKAYYTFIPSDVNYIDVLSDRLNQNYQAANIYDLDCNGSIGFGDLAIMCENWLDIGPNLPGDFYKDDNNIVNFPDFADFALIWQNP